MTQEWKPSSWGRRISGSPPWRLRLVGERLELFVDGQELTVAIDGASPLQVSKGLFWSRLTLSGMAVRGLPNAPAASLEDAIFGVLTEQHHCRRLEIFNTAYSMVCDWLASVREALHRADQERRWITHEQQEALLRSRPALPIEEDALRELLRDPDVRSRLTERVETVEEELKAWQSDWATAWAAFNERHVQREMVICKDLFDRVESKPLTEEQARAVICFDNRVQVIAAAGSGKTSTMVAKAAYAIQRGFVTPERILLLAFNKQAAEELKERAARSFERLGMEGVEVHASTFHALGLQTIGKATGRKPDVPDWAVDTADSLRKLTDIIDQLKDQSVAFRTQWDLFRIVYSQDLPPFGAHAAADVWDREGNGRLLTMAGDRVRSGEERTIANWLFYNGVSYEYERRYEFETATETHSQYYPDFYYPEIGLYHEHFALDAEGQPPAAFKDYLDGVDWKRQEHQRRGTALIETTSHQLRHDKTLNCLGEALTKRGVRLDPNPDRPTPDGGQKPMGNAELVGLVRTFISHTKSNCLTIEALGARLESLPTEAFKQRYRMFLEIAGPILEAWDEALVDEKGIDFEDMLNLAADHLEQGRHQSPYELVMADEFQDASRARARLCRALVHAPGRHFFAVGDDWQSINRFAGADVSVMADFRTWFGHGEVLRLEQTFRCPQELCDASSQFVSKNPAQLRKHVRSVTPSEGAVLQVIQVDHRDKLVSAIDGFLSRLHADLLEGRITPGRGGKVSVFVLGRYNADQAFVPDRWKARYGARIELSFLTVHRSKGSEADYVILPAMVSSSRNLSFPNTRADDPVLALAMPSGDNYPLAEERRLFYVALTRARRSVTMLTVRGQRSAFLDELVKDQSITVSDAEGEVVQEQKCPACDQGVIVTRSGRFGEFKACSNYPACEYKPKLGTVRAAPAEPPTQPSQQLGTPRPQPTAARDTGIDQPLLEALKAWRERAAKAQGLPPYVIFRDRALAAIVQARPTSRAALESIAGVGEDKFTLYGEAVLEIVRSSDVVRTPSH